MFQFYMAAALATFCAGKYEESVTWATKILQEQPEWLPALWRYAISSALAGRVDDARSAMARALKIDPNLRLSRMPILSVLRRADDRARHREAFLLAGMPE
jgi:predicted TPR repeat methyltransferase